MGQLESSTAVEKVAGNLVTQSALTVVAALAGGPLAALLPVLAGSLASERQRARVEQALVAISGILESHATKIRDLTDEQYKVINESVLALLQTTQAEKLSYLRAVVANAIAMREIEPQEATVLSRVVRDISAEEAAFLIRYFAFDGIHLMAPPAGQQFTDNIVRIDPGSKEALVVSGLLSLGLLAPAEPTWDAPNVLRFSRIVAKLIALLKIDA